jgi:hypothetical protein
MDNLNLPPRCRNSHPLSPDTVYVSPNGKKWRCRECLKACCRKYHKKKREFLVAQGYKPYDPARRTVETHCSKGHPWMPETTYITPSNPRKRQCKICRSARHKAKRRAGSLQMLHELHPDDGFTHVDD